jgi:hypothetical protein
MKLSPLDYIHECSVGVYEGGSGGGEKENILFFYSILMFNEFYHEYEYFRIKHTLSYIQRLNICHVSLFQFI